jgi:hypothetical protein
VSVFGFRVPGSEVQGLKKGGSARSYKAWKPEGLKILWLLSLQAMSHELSAMSYFA